MALWAARSTALEVDWREAADPADLREYDAFGPWIEPVRSVADMPPRFRPHYAEHADARFLLKVPRDEDRIDLRPGMDLYRAVLAIHNEGICLLRLQAGSVSTEVATWDRIVASRYWVELLVARWSLMLDDGSAIELDLNGAAAGNLTSAMNHVHARISAAAVPGWPAAVPPVAVAEDFYAAKLNQLRHQLMPPVLPVHVERGNRLCFDGRHRPRLSNGLMLVDTPAELVIVSRGEPIRSRFLPTHASAVTRVPYERLTSFTVAPPPAKGGPAFHLLVLRAGRQVIQEWCLDRPEGAIAALSGRGVPQAAQSDPVVGLR